MTNIFFNTDYTDYSKFKLLENNYLNILKEIPVFDISKVTIKRNAGDWLNDTADKIVDSLSNNKEWISSWDSSNTWFNFPLMYLNQTIGNADIICPNTINLLKQLNCINVAGFSLLLPNSSLPPHTDPTGPLYNSMALNMFLYGDSSNLIVQNNKYIHKDGKLVIFNSENTHYAENNGLVNRVILYIDFSTK